ncbi:MAG TPA: gamma-glutamyltransferase family protein, partial [Dyadobacter sp.]|nr:gamma-glutamyltransferase family protein [Dyadobacter sp.]
MKKKLLLLALSMCVSQLCSFGQSFNNFPVTTQKPPLHAKHWMAITGKPLAATSGAMIFSKGGNA